jgi:hypothetical protein
VPTTARRSVDIAVLSVLLLQWRQVLLLLLLLLLTLLLLLMVRQFYVATADGSGAMHRRSIADDTAAIIAAADPTECGRLVADLRSSEFLVAAARFHIVQQFLPLMVDGGSVQLVVARRQPVVAANGRRGVLDEDGRRCPLPLLPSPSASNQKHDDDSERDRQQRHEDAETRYQHQVYQSV